MTGDDIDIYDANLTRIGTMDWMEAHLTGQWHRTFHCWVFRKGSAQVLFQLRSPHGNWPDKFDVSAAGHLDAGEEVIDGIREVTEELGISVRSEDCRYIGDRVEVADQDNGQLNREYQAVYLLEVDASTIFRPDPEEVWGLFWLPIADGLDLFGRRKTKIEVTGIEFDPESKTYRDAVRTIEESSFIPRIQRYYMAGLIAAERAIEGRPDIAIS